MDKKNILLIVVGGVAVVFLFLFIVVFDSARRGQESLKKAEEEKSGLATEVDSLRGQQKGFTEKINSLNGHLDELNNERQRLQEQFDNASRERDELRGEVNRLNGDLSRTKAALQAAKSQQQATQAPAREVVPAAQSSYAGSAAGSNEYWASVLKQKAALEMKLDDLTTQVNDSKLAVTKLQREKSEVEQEIASLTRENQTLKREIEYNKKVTDSLTFDLTVEKNNSYETKNSLSTLLSENKTLKERLRTVSQRKESLEATLVDLKAKNVELENSIEKLQVFVKEKLQQVDSLREEFSEIKPAEVKKDLVEEPLPQRKEAVDLPPIVVHSDGAAQQKEIRQQVATLEKAAANIVAVNKDNNFVIINQGSVQGIKMGDSFKVYDSDNRPAGEVEVIQVRENISAADIKKEIQPLRAGFAVR